MLEENGIPSCRRIKNPYMRQPLKSQKQNSDRHNRRSQNHNQRSGIVCPDEEWQPKPGHAGRAHRMNSHDEVESGENRGEAADEDSQADRKSTRLNSSHEWRSYA